MRPTFDRFTIVRDYAHPVEKVFRAWTSIDAKLNWFRGPDGWICTEHTLDFRVGGAEVMRGEFPGKGSSSYSAHYYRIVPDQQICYSSDVVWDGEIYSASLVLVEFFPSETGTRMEFTEAITYFEPEHAHANVTDRARGTNMHFDWLVEYLDRP